MSFSTRSGAVKNYPRQETSSDHSCLIDNPYLALRDALPTNGGIDHLGITVPDIKSATEYFVAAFGTEVIYDVLSNRDTPLGGDEIEAAVGIARNTTVRAIRLLKLHDGPSIELFEYAGAEQRASSIPSDFGLQHLAIYVDDMAAAAERVQRAGGHLLAGPNGRWRPPIPGDSEKRSD